MNFPLAFGEGEGGEVANRCALFEMFFVVYPFSTELFSLWEYFSNLLIREISVIRLIRDSDELTNKQINHSTLQPVNMLSVQILLNTINRHEIQKGLNIAAITVNLRYCCLVSN
jgi:hypothetical protein